MIETCSITDLSWQNSHRHPGYWFREQQGWMYYQMTLLIGAANGSSDAPIAIWLADHLSVSTRSEAQLLV